VSQYPTPIAPLLSRRPLGGSGIAVRPIGYGAMALSAGKSAAGVPSEKEALAVIHAAIESGADLIDTADTYGLGFGEMGHNERLIGKALRAHPGHRVTVATKGGVLHGSGGWQAQGGAGALRKACEASLARLGLEAIPLYQLHHLDSEVPVEESAGALADLRREGKILHVGLSNARVEEIEAVRAIVPIVSVQNRCSVLDRSSWELGILPYCEATGLAFLAYAPVGGRRRMAEVGTHPALHEIGARHGASTFEVALAWLLAQSPALVAIPGGRRVESVTSSAAALNLQLGTGDLAALELSFPTGRDRSGFAGADRSRSSTLQTLQGG
jgi:aryl-alcohol dehydrogenase-like predicted oxidoreductase